MSRSYKHTPSCGDDNARNAKRFANKVVRHAEDVPNGNAYKKYYERWNIKDYWCCPYTYKEWVKSEHSLYHTWGKFNGEAMPSEEEMRKEYQKRCLRK